MIKLDEFDRELEAILGVDLTNDYDVESVSVDISKNAKTEDFTIISKFNDIKIHKSIEIGSLFVKYIPIESISLTKDEFLNSTACIYHFFLFYTLCNRGDIEYTEETFINFFGSAVGYIPTFYLQYYSDNETTLILDMDSFYYEIYSTINDETPIGKLFPEYISLLKKQKEKMYRVYDLKLNLDEFIPYSKNGTLLKTNRFMIEAYFLAIAYELVKHNYTVNKCAEITECGKWFVAYNKKDTLYCPECKKKRYSLQQANLKYKKITIKRCNDRKLSTSVEAVSKDKIWEDLIKEIENRYSEAKTIPEMKEYNEWLHKVNKENFKRARKNI